ncbi:MAG: Uma2 family endonuclease [Chloroflexi bacterium]|nr:Uma2 family endonuclease [Chloroflexota bacterium]
MAVEIQQLTVEQYLALEAESEIRREFIDGEIFPMTGGTGNHGAIIAYTIAALVNLLEDTDCVVRASTVRVKIDEFTYVYPDVSVVCGESVYADDDENHLVNPTVVVEVTSPSSIERDRVRKVELYGDIPSVQGYLILDQERVFAQWRTRSESGWHLRQFSDLTDEIELEPLGCVLRLADVYRSVKLDA